ncbi:DUF3899 domain-containing protein [Microaerobacter geothermalis]|uniref:DUF3899 domain-containing protein n=1 Tax=Microaerobacter geothermalis TaxID=674972 RepID=UPI001F313C49|nr:DUF3899 domain-containing protein [Microaerobacter geothermalis]MCF6092963.1 DUF3899 domain-containing protein [Microaerobacter geothermalis]
MNTHINRIWVVRGATFLVILFATLLLSFLGENTYFINLLNTSFLIGLFLLSIAGAGWVILGDFFITFAKGWKILFSRDKESEFWFDAEPLNEDEKIKKKLKGEVKTEWFVYLPFISGLMLIGLSIFLLLFF